MQGIKLKDFQIDTVNKLLNATNVGRKKEILLQAPTGSGKTIILLSYIEEYMEENENTIFVWLTPGKGELEEQSRIKMNKLLPNLRTKSIQDVLLNGFEKKDTAFINWETITKKGNTALKETERKNLFERITEAKNSGNNFIAIVDEEHLNKTIKAEGIIDFLNPNYIIRASATTKINKEAKLIEVEELDVISSGLITRALYINENVSNTDIPDDENEYLINLAIEKRKQIKEEYEKNRISVNPLIIIQVPSNSNELIKQIEKILDKNKYSYNRKNLAIWLADRKENIENIEENESEQAVLIMKQAISTGWDCPRAKILVKLRENMNDDFETQTIGRIRRMPQGHHYNNVLLDNCYLYTFDKKYEESVKEELKNNVYNSKVVFLKDDYKEIELNSITFKERFNGFDERQTFNLLFEHYVKKYGLNSKKKDNRLILEANDYVFNKTITNEILYGKFVRLREIQEAEKLTINSEINTHSNGFEFRDCINEISKKIGIPYDRTRLMLERMFLQRKVFTKKFISLNTAEFYAFIINNVELIKNDFYEAVNKGSRQLKTTPDIYLIKEWKFPEMDYIKYDPNMKDTSIYEKSVYKDYPSSTIKSKSERMFEKYCENSNKVKWFYKNGESSNTYLSIVYVDGIGKRWHFYPDFIIGDVNNKVWIIETKGGENVKGETKNIDIKVEIKFEALKDYSKKYGINWAFVRDYDKNEELYYCNTEYTEDMSGDNWRKLEEIL